MTAQGTDPPTDTETTKSPPPVEDGNARTADGYLAFDLRD
jgi:hypothetical protein